MSGNTIVSVVHQSQGSRSPTRQAAAVRVTKELCLCWQWLPTSVPESSPLSLSTSAPAPSTPVRRSASLTSPYLNLASRGSIGQRSASVVVLPGASSSAFPQQPVVRVSSVSVSSSLPPTTFIPLVHVVNRRPCKVGLGYSEEQATVRLAELTQKRLALDSHRDNRWQQGLVKYGHERAPWQFETILQLMAMTVCASWDQYSRGCQNRDRVDCQGSMRVLGVKRSVTPVFSCGALCTACGRRVTLYNYQPLYVVIGTVAEQVEQAVLPLSDSLTDTDEKYGTDERHDSHGEETESDIEVIDADEFKADSGGIGRARSTQSNAEAAWLTGSQAHDRRTARRIRQRRQQRQQQQQQVPQRRTRRSILLLFQDTKTAHRRVRHFITPPVQLSLSAGHCGLYHVTVLREATIYLVAGLRSSHLARLSNWSDSVQTVKHTTLFRYYKIIKQYVKLMYEKDQRDQQDQLRRVMEERKQRALGSGQSSDADLTHSARCLVLSGDGSWSTRGYSANQFTYVVCNLTRPTHPISGNVDMDHSVWLPPICYMECITTERTVKPYIAKRHSKCLPTDNSESALIATVQSHSVNSPMNSSASAESAMNSHTHLVSVKGQKNNGTWSPTTGSAGMEGVAFNSFLKHMTDNSLIDGVQLLVTDGDLKAASVLKDLAPLRHVTDPGHVYKHYQKLFLGLCTTKKDFVGLPYRMYTWLRRCHHTARDITRTEQDEVKRIDAMFQLMQLYMLQMIYHYHNLCDPTDCPHTSEQLVDGLIERDTDAICKVIVEWLQQKSGSDAATMADLWGVPAAVSVSASASSAAFTSISPSTSASQLQDLSQPSVSSNSSDISANSASALEMSQQSQITELSQLSVSEEGAALSDSEAPPLPPPLQSSSKTSSRTQSNASQRRAGKSKQAPKTVSFTESEDESQYAAIVVSAASMTLSDTKPISAYVLDPGDSSHNESAHSYSAIIDDDRAASATGEEDESARDSASASAGVESEAETVAEAQSLEGNSNTTDNDGRIVAEGGKEDKRRKGKMTQEVMKHIAELDKPENAPIKRYRDNVLKELGRRHSACVAAERDDQPRPYGTSRASSAESVEHSWRLWIPMEGGPSSKSPTWSSLFTSLVVETMHDEKLKSICHGFGTTHNESFNSQRARFTPKDVDMYMLFECRAQICVLNRNRGASWVQELFTDMGLPWLEKDAKRIQRSEFLRGQSHEVAQRQRHADTTKLRQKAVADIMDKVLSQKDKEVAAFQEKQQKLAETKRMLEALVAKAATKGNRRHTGPVTRLKETQARLEVIEIDMEDALSEQHSLKLSQADVSMQLTGVPVVVAPRIASSRVDVALPDSDMATIVPIPSPSPSAKKARQEKRTSAQKKPSAAYKSPVEKRKIVAEVIQVVDNENPMYHAVAAKVKAVAPTHKRVKVAAAAAVAVRAFGTDVTNRIQ